MISVSQRVRIAVLCVVFAFSASYAVAGPAVPLPPFPPGTSSVVNGPAVPLPPFPPGTSFAVNGPAVPLSLIHI